MRKSSIVFKAELDAIEKWAIAENARGQAFIMWCGDHWNEISEQDL